MKTFCIAFFGIATLLPARVGAQCVKDFVPKSVIEAEVVKVEGDVKSVIEKGIAAIKAKL